MNKNRNAIKIMMLVMGLLVVGGLPFGYMKWRNDRRIFYENKLAQSASADIGTKKITYALMEGWNFIAFPMNPVTVKTATELIKSVGDAGGYVTTVSRWNGDRWQEFSQRLTEKYGEDFELKAGEAYFVLNHVQVDWQVTGTSLPLDDDYGVVTLKPGWNAVGLIPGEMIEAKSVLDSVNSAGTERANEIDRWISGNWDVYVKRWYSDVNIQEYGNNFAIEDFRGYMINAREKIILRTTE